MEDRFALSVSPACSCRGLSFRVRIDSDEQVALLTCEAGHHSLLLDSADYWVDVTQERRPPEKKCSCGSKQWFVHLDYEFREGTESVRSIDVRLQCSSCQKERIAMSIDVDYEPTDELVSTPLHPCANPWVKPKRTEITALWTPTDFDAFVYQANQSAGSKVFVAPWRERPEPFQGPNLSRQLNMERPFNVFLTIDDVPWPETLRDAWKDLPVVHVGSRTTMQYSTGTGHLYYIQYAEQVICGNLIVDQPPEFVQFARLNRDWLFQTYTSSRGKNTADNLSEYERLWRR